MDLDISFGRWLRAQLDEATFAAAWAEDQAMTLEQAIAYALNATSPAPSG